ncbi:MFS transporter [Chloroflexota bacterium]
MASEEVQQPLGAKPRFFYGYIIVILAFLIMLVMHGVFIAFGVFFNPVLTEFGWARATTSGAFSVSMIFIGTLGIVVGRLTDRFGPRIVLTFCGILLGIGYMLMSQISALWQFYLFYGVIIGLGMSGGWIPVMSTTARWFVKKRGMMTGFVVAGMGIGGMIAPPVANQLISIYDWRTAYIILGSVVMVTVVTAAQFLRRDPSQKGLTPYGHTDSTEYTFESGATSLSFKEALRRRQFWLLTTSLFCFGVLIYTIAVHIAPHTTNLGFSTTTAATILAAVGGVSILGNIILGSIGDRIGNGRSYAICFILLSAASFWLMPATEVWQLFLFASVFGFARGGGDAVESPLTADLFGLRAHGVIYGFICFGFTIGAAVGPFLAGYIFDVTNSYQLAFVALAVVGIIAFVLTAALRPIQRLETET